MYSHLSRRGQDKLDFLTRLAIFQILPIHKLIMISIGLSFHCDITTISMMTVSSFVAKIETSRSSNKDSTDACKAGNEDFRGSNIPRSSDINKCEPNCLWNIYKRQIKKKNWIHKVEHDNGSQTTHLQLKQLIFKLKFTCVKNRIRQNNRMTPLYRWATCNE